MKFLVLLCFGFFVLPTQANFLTSDLIKTDNYNINVIMARANMYIAQEEYLIRKANLSEAQNKLKIAQKMNNEAMKLFHEKKKIFDNERRRADTKYGSPGMTGYGQPLYGQPYNPAKNSNRQPPTSKK